MDEQQMMEQNAPATVQVSVVLAWADHVQQVDLQLPPGSTLGEAVQQSGLLASLPPEMQQMPLEERKMGIFGKLKPAATVLRDGDRIELYRPLIADPKDARRRRAESTPRPKRIHPNQKRPPQ